MFTLSLLLWIYRVSLTGVSWWVGLLLLCTSGQSSQQDIYCMCRFHSFSLPGCSLWHLEWYCNFQLPGPLQEPYLEIEAKNCFSWINFKINHVNSNPLHSNLLLGPILKLTSWCRSKIHYENLNVCKGRVLRNSVLRNSYICFSHMLYNIMSSMWIIS